MKLIIMLISLTVFSLGICLRIERLNAQAGGVIPRVHTGEGNPKWRCPFDLSERNWRQMHLRDWENPEAVNRPLTPEETTRMQKDIRRSHAEAGLRDWCGSWGLLQYPLALLVVVLGVVDGCRRPSTPQRIAAFACAAVGAICLCFAIGRAYLPSLGW